MPSAMSGQRSPAPIPARAGVGLRAPHLAQFLRERPDVAFLEVHAENYFHDGGAGPASLGRLRETYPLSLHGVGLGLGSADPLEPRHLRRLGVAVRRYEPALVSEHACWGFVDGEHFNDLLPLPYTPEAVGHLARRIRDVQDALGRRILIENVSQYLRFRHSTLTEGEYLAAIAAESGCGLLLDINNLYVNAVNLGADPAATLGALDPATVAQYHLAGHTRKVIDGHALLIDDHGSRVCDEVWALYALALGRIGPRPTLIEWDTDVPALPVLLAEAAAADACMEARRAEAA
jgi:hypothetical protein